MLFGKGKQFYKVTAFFKLKLFHVELLQNDRFVIQLNMFLLPYVFSIELDFLKVLDILFFFSKIFDKMLAFLNL